MVNIKDADLLIIKTILAAPSVPKVILTDEQILAIAILPALRDYFTKFPIQEEFESALTSNVEVTINFPDDETFGVTHAAVVEKNMGASGNNTNLTLWEMVNAQRSGLNSYSNSTYGIKGFNPGGLKSTFQATYQSLTSMQKSTAANKVRVDIDNRIVSFFTNVPGNGYIIWAKWSEDFNRVRFTQKNNVIKLCQANLLEHLTNTASLINDTAAEIQVNLAELKAKITELRTEVYTKWNETTDIVLVRT